MKNTRIKLSWYTVVALTVVSLVAIYKDMEGVASAAIAGVLTVTMAYLGSRAFTKTTAMKTDKEDLP